MKWTRSKSNCMEFSTLSFGVRHYISMTHDPHTTIYHYVYSKNGERIHYGYRNANNWDEAEQLAIRYIRMELSWQTERWSRLLNDFDKEVSANENLL